MISSPSSLPNTAASRKIVNGENKGRKKKVVILRSAEESNGFGELVLITFSGS